VTCALVALAAPASAEARAASACATADPLATMECLVNETRAQHRLPPVRLSGTLIRSARLRANAIVRCRQFSHTPCGQSFTAPFRAVGYTRRSSIAENLAWGSGHLGSAQHALARWLASPPHRRVLFTRRWRELGVSAVSANGLFAPGVNTLWVAQFGRRF
jgi:uncharacterized protein YkwD